MEIDYIKIRCDNGYMYGGNQSLFGKKAGHSGCGMIAACDVILYFSGKRSMPFSEYEAFVSEFRDKEAYRFSLNLIGIPLRKMVRMLNSHIMGREYVFRSRLKFTEASLREFISDSLSEGLPVIVRIGFNGNKLPYRMQRSDGSMSSGKVGWHYITVTGISDDGKLIFSSWGRKGELEADQLYKHFGITGGVLADKNIPVNKEY